MHTLSLVLLSLLALAARAVQLRMRFAGWPRLWAIASGPFTVELRRRAGLVRLADDSMAFPQPRESRVLCLRLAGIPLWSQVAIVGLPASSDARIDHVAATEFDHLFDCHFRLGWPQRRRARAIARAH